MLKDYLDMDINKLNSLYEENLNNVQKVAFNKFKSGENLSIIGYSGTGKSYLIKTINSYNFGIKFHLYESFIIIFKNVSIIS